MSVGLPNSRKDWDTRALTHKRTTQKMTETCHIPPRHWETRRSQDHASPIGITNTIRTWRDKIGDSICEVLPSAPPGMSLQPCGARRSCSQVSVTSGTLLSPTSCNNVLAVKGASLGVSRGPGMELRNPPSLDVDSRACRMPSTMSTAGHHLP